MTTTPLTPNKKYGVWLISAVLFLGFLGSAKRLVQGRSTHVNTSETVTGGNVDPSPIYPYGSSVIYLTGSTTNISATQSPSSPLSIAEPYNQTFTLTPTNPANQAYNINWSVNGSLNSTNITACYNSTTCNFTGNLTSAGAYSYIATITGETNTSHYTWNLNVTENDTTAPTISAVSIAALSSSTIQVNWTTNEAANSSVNYGTSLSLGTYSNDASLSTSHSITLITLASSTLYYINVTSCDASGNCATNGTNNATTTAASGGGGGGGSIETSDDCTTLSLGCGLNGTNNQTPDSQNPSAPNYLLPIAILTTILAIGVAFVLW